MFQEKCINCAVKQFLNLHARKVFLHAHIISDISYGSTLFDSASENTLKPFLSVHKHAIKAVLFTSTSVVCSDYTDLKIFWIKKLFASNKAILMNKIIVGNAPHTLQNKFEPTARETDKLQVPVPRIDLFKSSLLYSGCLLWNTLPPTLGSMNSTVKFKETLI